MRNKIVWTQELTAAAKAIAADTWTPPYWPETWESVQQRAAEMRFMRAGDTLEHWQDDAVQCMRSRYQGFQSHERPQSVTDFESAWAAAYTLANGESGQ
jgi:hypothetical protein